MDIDAVIRDMTAYVQDNIIVTVILVLFLLFMLLRHPKALFTLAALGALAYGIAWLFERLAQTGLG